MNSVGLVPMGENYTRLAIITVQLVVKKKTLTNVQLPEFGRHNSQVIQ